MLKNYLLTALRNLLRNKTSSILNIAGLAAGIASCLFIYLYVTDELSYDKGFSKADRIHRIQSFYFFDDVEDKFGITPFPTATTIAREFPEIEAATRLTPNGQQFIKLDQQVYQTEEIYLADSNFFQVFDFPMVYGDPATVLTQPYNMVLPKSEAERIFGNENPVGKTITWEPDLYKITGVYDDKAFNTHIVTGIVVSMKSLNAETMGQLSENWGNNNSYSYVLLRDETQASQLQSKLTQVVETYQLPQWKTFGFQGKIEMHHEKLSEVHFNDFLIYDTPKKGNITYVYIFSIVAIITLIIACINFINLATAAASRRAKEVAMRKVVGASRAQLIKQFIGEAFLVTLFAALLGIVIVELLMPAFNNITAKQMTSANLFSGSTLMAILGLVAFIGIIAGSYPAFYISKLPVVSIFREARTSLGKSGWMRKILVTFQFTLSIALIIATLTVLSQLNYMRNKDLGFTKENMLAITLPPGDSTQYAPLQALKSELKNLTTVNNVARSAQLPGQEIGRWVFNVRTSSGNQDKPIATMFTDAEYLKMSRMNLTEGRLFTEADASNQLGYCLVNEAMVKSMGWTDALSEKLVIPGDDQNPGQEVQVIGVIRDFHFASLHHPIEPMVIAQQSPRGVGGNLIVELKSGNPSESLSQIESSWKKVFANKEFNYVFMEDNFRKMYEAEEKVFSVFIYFAVLAIVLCCLGLYGLSAYTTEQRTKEIGIRKVMGASVNNILVLLNKDFLILVVFSIVLAFPLAWYAVQHWLENFAYRTGVDPMYFVAASIFAILITLLTVSLHAMNTALRDPIKALRYE